MICRVANGLGVHTNSKVAKRVQRPTKRIDGADEDELKALLGDEAEADATAVPKRRGSAGRRPDHPAPKPPHYEAVGLLSLIASRFLLILTFLGSYE